MWELGEEFDSYQNCMNLKAAMTKFKNREAQWRRRSGVRTSYMK